MSPCHNCDAPAASFSQNGKPVCGECYRVLDPEGRCPTCRKKASEDCKAYT